MCGRTQHKAKISHCGCLAIWHPNYKSCGNKALCRWHIKCADNAGQMPRNPCQSSCHHEGAKCPVELPQMCEKKMAKQGGTSVPNGLGPFRPHRGPFVLTLEEFPLASGQPFYCEGAKPPVLYALTISVLRHGNWLTPNQCGALAMTCFLTDNAKALPSVNIRLSTVARHQ